VLASTDPQRGRLTRSAGGDRGLFRAGARAGLAGGCTLWRSGRDDWSLWGGSLADWARRPM